MTELTFEDLDGEMIVVNGRVYRVRGDGVVTEAEPTAQAPFAVARGEGECAV